MALSAGPSASTSGKTFSPAKIFREYISSPARVTCLDIDTKGEYLLTTASDEALHIYDCRKGRHLKPLYSKKYGCCLARFTHAKASIIHTSSKEDGKVQVCCSKYSHLSTDSLPDALRYLDTNKGSYVRYFKGHAGLVTTLSMAPNGDHFLSAAQDNTIKLWDLRNKDPQGQLKVVEPASVTYDNTGAVFAVMHNYNSTLALFDTRNFDAPPFLSKPVVDPILPQRSAPPRPPFNTSCTFSRDGKWILVGTSGATHYVLDAFDGNIVARLEGHQGFDKLTGKPQPAESGAEVCWSPDSRFVISGSKDGKVAVWDVNPPAPYAETGPNFTLQPMYMFAGGHDNEVRAVAFNPRLAMFATGSTELTLWTMAP